MKNKLMRAATLLMVLTLMTSCFVGSTFAKYTSETTMSATASVAKWLIKVENQNIVDGNADSFTVDLFSTAYEIAAPSALVADADVTSGKIAPGTEGKFELNIENASEVSAEYAIDYTVNEAGVPLKWSTDGLTWTEDLGDVAASNATKIAIGGSAAVTVYWKWDFEIDNDVDTTLGVAATAAPSVQIDITVEQVD